MNDKNKMQTLLFDLDKNKVKEDDPKLFELYEKYRYYWKWFLLSAGLFLMLTFVYLRYANNEYEVFTTIFISDRDNGGLTTERSAFQDLGILNSNSQSSVYNEITILKSRSLIEKVIKKLRINITFHEVGRVKNSEIYGTDVPFKINFLIQDSVLYNLDTSFVIRARSKSRYLLSDIDNNPIQEVAFGKNVNMKFGEINVTPSNDESLEIGDELIIKINPINTVVNFYREKLNVNVENENSSIVALSLKDAVIEKGKDVLDNVAQQYILNGIEYKTLVAQNTDKFINERIKDVYNSLTDVDQGVETFKVKNKLTDLGVEAGLDISSNAEIQERIIDLNSQINLIEFIMDHLKNNPESLIPANLGLQDASTNENTNNYNRLLLEKNRIIKSSSKLNPTVINLEYQIETLRKGIEQSLRNFESSLTFELNEVKNQEYFINSKRRAAPKQEREFQDIKRKQQIVESLYLYLLQKREENVISLGMPIPNAKIIDVANGDDLPVYPKPLLSYVVSLFLGFMVPIIIISIKSLLDNLVHSSDDVRKVVKAPIIGEIPLTNSKKKLVFDNKGNSGIAESFRLLRTNLEFMMPNSKGESKVVFITSTLSGEGKTFVAINLASTLSLLNKRVLLVGADIRKPKISSYLGIKSKKGLTNFLLDESVQIEDLIITLNDKSFDVLDSGEIPPNPSELLLNGRFEDVMDYGRKFYDYVIVDTSPVNMVTDTLLLGHHANLFIYVIRAEFLDKRLLEVSQMMYENKRLPNMSILVNGVNVERKGYGYGYGYGNVEDKKFTWRSIFS